MLLNYGVGEDSRVPWIARRSNQSILKEISPEYSWKDWCWSWRSNLWLPDAKNWLFGKDPNAVKDWRQEKKGMTEDEMAGCHHWRNGHEFEQAPGVGDGQRSLVCCSPWGCKESDTTEWLDWTELSIFTATDPLWDFAHVFSLLFCFLNLEGHLKSYQSLHKALQGNWSTSCSFLSSLSTKCSVQSAFLKVEAGLSFTL